MFNGVSSLLIHFLDCNPVHIFSKLYTQVMFLWFAEIFVFSSGSFKENEIWWRTFVRSTRKHLKFLLERISKILHGKKCRWKLFCVPKGVSFLINKRWPIINSGKDIQTKIILTIRLPAYLSRVNVGSNY